MSRIRHTLPAAITAALLALTACSSSDDGSGDTPAPTTSTAPAEETPQTDDEDVQADLAALTQSVHDYIEALTAGDTTTAWPMLSTRCQETWGQEGLDERTQNALALLAGQQAEGITVDDLSGDLARVSYTVGTEQRHGQPWTRQDGTWRYDDC